MQPQKHIRASQSHIPATVQGVAMAQLPAKERIDKRCSSSDYDSAMITVEAALALCSLLMFLFLALATLATVVYQLQIIDNAREVARLTARGERDALSLIHLEPKIHLTTYYQGNLVHVEATVTVPVINIHLRAHSIALLERSI